MTEQPDDITAILDQSDLVQREARDEILRLRASLAAAPDMAEALRILIDAIEWKRTHGMLEDAMSAARAALAKAKGEA